jgi:hypothetical protein
MSLLLWRRSAVRQRQADVVEVNTSTGRNQRMKKKTKALVLAVIGHSFLVTAAGYGAITSAECADFSGNPGSPFIVPEQLGHGANSIKGNLPGKLDSGIEADGDVNVIPEPSTGLLFGTLGVALLCLRKKA